ncbi:MAG: DUF1572 family protein [Planctomycetota bacterium]|nr:DUF1572 family protein [Planctomycetota bacterium]
MPATLETVSTAVTSHGCQEFDEALRIISHCLDQLDDDQTWWRPAESMNSIANLLLHLSGNVRQWIVSGVGGAPDVRKRQEEFDQRDMSPKHHLMTILTTAVEDAKDALAGTSAADLLRTRSVQGNAVTGIKAIFHATAHFRGHTQEIVHMTRCQLGDTYEFDFVPRNNDLTNP